MPFKDYERHKENARQNYYKNRDKRLQQVKEYYINNWDAKQEYRTKWLNENPEKVKEFKRKYAHSDKGKMAFRKAVDKWVAGNPEKRLAHYAIHNAIRRGELAKPNQCERCGQQGRIHGHHYLGYAKQNQLKVMWLCHKCHKKEHNDIKNNLYITRA